MDMMAGETLASTQIQTVGVIGAGQMGGGIAQVCAAAGFQVVLNDKDPGRLTAGLAAIEAGLDRQSAKGQITQSDRDDALSRISAAGSFGELVNCDLVIEAATEDLAVKRAILADLDPHLPPGVLVASNTSSLSITRLATVTSRAERFIGIHFMNPAPVMKLVELIRGIATSEETYQTAREFVERLDKAAVASEDSPAFIVNRILLSMINEAIFALYEGVGSITSIDASMRLGANHPMGPLQLADFIGLDTCLAIMRTLHRGLADSKYRPCPLLVKYVEAGWLGRKAGRGFYDYRDGEPRPTR